MMFSRFYRQTGRSDQGRLLANRLILRDGDLVHRDSTVTLRYRRL